VPDRFQEWLDEAEAVDFMNMKASINVDKEDFRKIASGERTRVEHVDGRMIGLRKIFCGDDSDNVPAIHIWANEKGEQVRVTNSKFEKIYEELLTSPNEQIGHRDLLERSDAVLAAIKKATKQRDVPFGIRDRLERQIKLVVLDPRVFPKEITDRFQETVQAELGRPKISHGSVSMQNLLEGTRFVGGKDESSEASIFKEIDRIKGTALF